MVAGVIINQDRICGEKNDLGGTSSGMEDNEVEKGVGLHRGSDPLVN